MIPGNTPQEFFGAAAAAAAGGAPANRSVRFNSADSAYLSRTPASAGNRTTWTWSGWVKRSALGSFQDIFSAGTSGTDYFTIRFNTTDNLDIFDRPSSGNVGQLVTSAVFRDVSAWYHIVYVWDTDNGTAADRRRLYVNGVRVTTFSTDSTPSSGAQSRLNSTLPHAIGRYNPGSSLYFDGYLALVHFIDGQALTPSSFGETSATTGRWEAKTYAGTYSGNSFFLDFSDNSAATATTLGKDKAGSNNWTPNNLSVTAGSGNDSLRDHPTSAGTSTGLGGEVSGNYCTINPLGVSANTPTISDGNLQMTLGDLQGARLGTIGVTSGKWYWEIVYTAATGFDGMVGIARQAHNLSNYVGSSSDSWGYYYTGVKYNAASPTSYGSSWTIGDVIGVALDMDNLALYFSKNGTWQNSGVPTSGASKTGAAYTNLSGEIFPALNAFGGTQVANFGQRAWSYTAPSGFSPLVDTLLPTPTIAKPNTVMDAVAYTGTGSSNTITLPGSFNPDLIWIKRRSAASDHVLMDVVRGFGSANTKVLYSNLTNSEDTTSVIASTSSTGFTIGGSGIETNANGSTYVAWTFDAGSSNATNTSGTITSTVRANISAGFSIQTWTSSGGTQSWGHGLGVAPEFVIVKRRNVGQDWYVWHKSLTSSQYLFLNLTSSVQSFSNIWGTSGPSSSLITYATSSGDHVSYAWAPVAGYSAFGSYTGTGSATDSPFIWTGFKPAVVIVKRSNGSADWVIQDNKRPGYNTNTLYLRPNSSSEETDSTGETNKNYIDFLSNGFKLRGSDLNTNAAQTYIYCAWAEAPFPYARAR